MYSKRLFDIFISVVGIVILAPFIAFIALLIKLTSKGPIFFRQKRVGRGEVIFTILKFRTMVTGAEQQGPLITIGDSDPRITNIGYFLRKYKIDELPQLFNVLMGDMSFVGPRPEVPKYVSLYSLKQKEIFSIRPGITDLASIVYRNESEILKNFKDSEKAYIEKIMPDKLRLNLEYLETRSFWLDLKIIFKTFTTLLF